MEDGSLEDRKGDGKILLRWILRKNIVRRV
jgi:hypothetical protein